MSDRFEICQEITAKWEGGWSDHPNDPGGKTMYGVTEARWHEYQKKMGIKLTPVRSITKAQALAFYRSEFWNACGAPKLFPGVDLAVHDASVNSGVSRGRKWLLSSVGNHGHDETVRRICRARLSFMKSLKIWTTFGKGWSRRVNDIEVKGVVMALEAMGKSKAQIQSAAAVQVVQAENTAKSANAQSKTATAGALGTPAVSSTLGDMATYEWMLLGGVTLAFLAIAVYLIAKRRENEDRAVAYRAVLA